ncbi:MAG: Holliday junction resolvase RuvX [Clostridiales bacterium]|nr:Holliday junction resolvase RuvX [Clostridiales bacterium]
MRILGVDYGDKRTGIAISDPTGSIASGLFTMTADGKKQLAAQVAQIAKERECDFIVLGNPINMNGSRGERSEKAVQFGTLLQQTSGLDVVMVDERLSTSEAHVYLNMTNTRGKNRKKRVDTLAAEIILQSYLDQRLNQKIKQ